MPLAFVVAFAAAGARADDAPRSSGFRLGIRTGYALSFGAVAEQSNLHDVMPGHLPFWIDVGWRPSAAIVLGVFGAAGIGAVANGCPTGFTCNATLMRVGVNAHVHLRPDKLVDPWLGVGIGWESLSIAIVGNDGGQVERASGLELFDVQIGVDFQVAAGVRVGPFAALTTGQYSSISTSDREDSEFVRRLHHWVIFGARAAYDL